MRLHITKTSLTLYLTAMQLGEKQQLFVINYRKVGSYFD